MARIPRIKPENVLDRIKKEGPKALLTLGEARALIAARIRMPGESERTVRRIIATKLTRSADQGQNAVEGGLTREKDGRFTASEIAYWARRRYDGLFEDLPVLPPVFTEKINEGAHVTDQHGSYVLPSTLSECHRVILRMFKEMGIMNFELAAARKKVAKCRAARFANKSSD